MRHWLPEIVAASLFPLLLAQGRRTRRMTVRLPEAKGPNHGIALPTQTGQSSTALRLLAIGESPVAGVGVDTQEEAITAHLARTLAERLQQPVGWQALGANGATIRSATPTLTTQLPLHSVDIVLVAFGVNDSTEFRPVPHYRRELTSLIDILQTRLKPKLVIISGVPPLHLFPALPEPLRYVLGLKAKALDRAAHQVAKAVTDAIYAPMPASLTDRALMASDGYHPSASGAALWARHIVAAIEAHPLIASSPAHQLK